MPVTKRMERVYKKESVIFSAGNAARGACDGLHGEAAARIVQSTDEFAIIEVGCPCGRKIEVFCNYGSAEGG